ncbi:MAG: helix-turn-helix transcriptional regulator, partial [Bacteroidales bacterium]|nr:helix-turn-helix transcriptional regulator [Bacteroidales bacterium]
MEKMKVYSQEEMLDRTLGPKGTPERDEYDAQVKDYLVGLAIRRAREAQNLTQEQLGERIGVQRARISSIEKGTNLRLSTLRRIFTALGMEVNLSIGDMQPI